METAIRWSPNSTTSEQRFLVADVVGRTFKHCRVTKYTNQDFRYETLSTHTRAPVFRAFDWAPFDEAIVAVGQWSGEAAVLNIKNGSQVFSLPIKSQRQCNAVAFNRTGLLATGLERVRNDFCLNVFDVNQRISAQSQLSSGSSRQPIDPIRKFASSEGITSIKFFTKQPDTLIAGVKGACIRIYDLRESTGGPSLQYHTTYVHNISIDPTNENHFASAGPSRDTAIHIWDRRLAVKPVSIGLNHSLEENARDGPTLVLRNAFEIGNRSDQANLWGLRYCPTERGCLGVLSSHGEFKTFETREEENHGQGDTSIVEGSPQIHPSQRARQLFTKKVNEVERPYSNRYQHRKEIDRIVSFDFTNLVGSRGRACAVLLRGNHNIEIHQLQERHPTLAVSLAGNLLLKKQNTFLHSTSLDHLGTNNAYNLNSGLSKESGHAQAANDSEKEEFQLSNILDVRRTDANNNTQTLKTSVSVNVTSTQLTDHEARHRCADGYLLDCEKNMRIIADHPHLQSMWSWIGRARSHAVDDGMVAKQLDLSYLGAYCLWHGEVDRSPGSGSPPNGEQRSYVSGAIKELSNDLQLPEIALPQTAKQEHRLLSLHTLGLAFAADELVEKVQELTQNHQSTEAALLALMYNERHLAGDALKGGKSPQVHQTLALAIVSVRSGQIDSGWQETIIEIAKEFEDPFARAILALVSQDNWQGVLSEVSLPLQYRLGITLMHLDDQQITSFLQQEMASAIKEGLVEGILITGLNQNAMDLFEAYIARSGDLQSSVLAMSFTVPSYIQDLRFQVWREEYRSMMNSWKMPLERTRFDVQSTKLAGSSSRNTSQQKFFQSMTPPQVTLRCINCDQALDRNPNHQKSNALSKTAGSTVHEGSIFGTPKSGTVCPKCGRHMPRCAVCSMWVGVPNPHRPGVGAAEVGKSTTLMANLINFCQSCRHVSHGSHAQEWFAAHEVCPSPGCECRCTSLDGGGDQKGV